MYTITHTLTGETLKNETGKVFSFDNYRDAKAASALLANYEVTLL